MVEFLRLAFAIPTTIAGSLNKNSDKGFKGPEDD